ncbi:MAG: fibronectin type III domain-containing protein [Chloroflexota bacterium]
MRRRFVLAFVLAVLSSGALPFATLARSAGQLNAQSIPGRQVIVRAGHTLITPKRIPAPLPARALNGQLPAATADIQVAYTGFSPDAQAAFDAAVAVWESLIISPKIIHVTAAWTPLGEGVLGSAGPTNFYRLPAGDRWYPAALYEAICNCESLFATEIDADFNSAFADWYLGTDGNAPADKYDFYSVVLHELGHGLGFVSSFVVSGSSGKWGYPSGGVTYPFGFDRDEWSDATDGNLLTNTSVYPNNSAALKTQLTDGEVYFGGANVVAANGGTRALLYAPDPWDAGSSNSHFDEAAFPAGNENALMTPYLDNGEVNHDPGPLTLALFQDIGWSLTGSTTAPGQPISVTAVAGDAQALVSWVAPSSNGGSPITGYSVTSSPDAETCAANGATLSCTVTDLANGTPYTFTVTATNAVATGSPSEPSNSVTPMAPAGPANDNFASAESITGVFGAASGSNVNATGESGEPLNTTLSSPIESIWYRWQAPATGVAVIDLCGSSFDTTVGVYTGAAVATLMLISSDDDGGCGLTSRATFTAANGTTYFISVDGYGSMHGAIYLAYSLTAAATVPGAPSGVTAVAGNGQATVNWSAPASSGGSPITSYSATSSPDAKTCTTPNGIILSCTATGLTNGVAYTFTVVATNAVGPGLASAPSAGVTPTAPPAGSFKPDGRIRLGTGTFIGNNIYNTTGLNQAKTGAKLRGATIKFGISIQNDGSSADSFRLAVSGASSAMYTVTYWHGTTNITAAVVAGTFSTPSLAPGKTYLVTVKVKVNSSATKGSSTTRLVTISSGGDPTKHDAVSFTGKRK